MKRAALSAILFYGATYLALGQEASPGFEAADVQGSAKNAARQAVRSGVTRGGRYEVKNATMVDLISLAYGFEANRILGGPNWLEMNRFDVVAKLPTDN